MAARADDIISLAIPEENGCLAFSDNQLGSELDFRRSRLRNPMDHLSTGFIEPLNHFQKLTHIFLLVA